MSKIYQVSQRRYEQPLSDFFTTAAIKCHCHPKYRMMEILRFYKRNMHHANLICIRNLLLNLHCTEDIRFPFILHTGYKNIDVVQFTDVACTRRESSRAATVGSPFIILASVLTECYRNLLQDIYGTSSKRLFIEL